MASNRPYRTGIGGIERKIQENLNMNDKNISEAFRDLSKLVDMAKDMSVIARSISQKLREKGADSISTDETLAFKSHLLSLGVESLQDQDPVTRRKFTSDTKYYKELAREVHRLVASLIRDKGGQMALTDIYCTVNRARGFQLISPEDLLNACEQMETQKLGLRLVRYSSGLVVLTSDDYDETAVAEHTLEMINQCGNCSAHQLSLTASIPISLARQRLLNCERAGLACRDESVHGLIFYPNKFLTPQM